MKLSILSDLFTNCWWWLLLWMFLAFLLGWLLRKLFGSKDAECCEELNEWKKKYANLEVQYNNLHLSKERVQTVPPANLGVKATATSPYAKLKNDNLQIIEGIGPKMEEVLKKHSVGNWPSLASQTAEGLRNLLDKENPTRYKIIDPTTWPDQAQLAVDGKWQDLIALQKNLDTGKADAKGETDSKLEKMMIKLGLLKKWKRDDLKAVEGIGPKIESLFHDNGIKTWLDLANTSVDKLKQIMEGAGSRFKLADPGTWPKQAQLAHEEKWDELKEYQDFLDGGK